MCMIMRDFGLEFFISIMCLFNFGNRIMLVSQNDLGCYPFSCVFWKGMCRIDTIFYLFDWFHQWKYVGIGFSLWEDFLTTNLNALIDTELFRFFFFLIHLGWTLVICVKFIGKKLFNILLFSFQYHICRIWNDIPYLISIIHNLCFFSFFLISLASNLAVL